MAVLAERNHCNCTHRDTAVVVADSQVQDMPGEAAPAFGKDNPLAVVAANSQM